MIRVIKDPVTEMAAFNAGEVDFIASFSPGARRHDEGARSRKPRS